MTARRLEWYLRAMEKNSFFSLCHIVSYFIGFGIKYSFINKYPNNKKPRKYKLFVYARFFR